MKLGALLNTDRLETFEEHTARNNAERKRQVRTARVDVARRNEAWTEIPETRLVPRGRFLVDAETDLVYRLSAGDVFAPGSASVAYVTPTMRLTFYVTGDGDVVFLEQPLGRRTWSDIVARRAR